MTFSGKSVFKMDRRIYLIFVFVVAVAIANALLSTFKINNNKNTIYEITKYTNPALENLEDFNLLVTRSRMFISNWVYLPNNNNDKNNLIQLNGVAYPNLKSKLSKLSGGWHSETSVKQVNKLFSEYESIIHEQEKIMKSLVDFNDYEDPMKKFLAEEQLESEIIPSTNKIMVNLRELIAIKKEEAQIMQDRMLQDNVHLLMIVFTLAILIIISVMAAGVYLMKKVIIPLMNVREVMLRMSEGELPAVAVEPGKSAIVEMKGALRQLRDGLQRTSSFAGEIGKSNFNSDFSPLSENDVLGHALLEMRERLKYAYEQDTIRNWTSEGFSIMSSIIHKNTEDIKQLSEELIGELVKYIQAQQGVLYLVNDEIASASFIEPSGCFAPNRDVLQKGKILMNEGLIGQVVASNSKIHLKDISDTTSVIETGTTSIMVCDIFLMPLFAGGKVIGVIEIKSTHSISSIQTDFIEKISEPIASNILNLKANLLTRKLLEESQLKTKELAQQDEELRQINFELVNQSRKLKSSESELRIQQDILKGVNSELEAKAELLEDKNLTIEDAHKALAIKAEQLEISSKYKSDFLANMSHELRTPLNSVLILAKLLSENRNGNMNDKQMEHARVIHKSGSDLLVIINDILDLSKIEAGKLEIFKEETEINEICTNMESLFREVSMEKQISFYTNIDPNLSSCIYTDRIRIEQILKNLLSNAFKFTPIDGTVRLQVDTAPKGLEFKNDKLRKCTEICCISVIDTGIGIPGDKQKLIFDAFNQADSSITRKYGGTGLGLTICQQLISLLGGDIAVESNAGEGSIFKLYLPLNDTNKDIAIVKNKIDSKLLVANKIDNFESAGNVLVLTTKEKDFAEWKRLFSIENFKVTYADDFNLNSILIKPDVVILDVTLSDMAYVEIVEAIKGNSFTNKATIICRSISEYVPKKISKDVKIHTTEAITSKLVSEILEKVHESSNSMASFIKLNSAKDSTGELNLAFKDVNISQGPQRLLGKKILVADDDIRNIYSMSTIFESEGAEVICAMDGAEAIDKLNENLDIHLIIMDIMMPQMDGLKAIQIIRKIDRNIQLPIIAVTAKAMRGDREICLAAGATEYITKPVNVELLMNAVIVSLKMNIA